MATTYSLRTRVLSSNPYRNIYSTTNTFDNSYDNNNSNSSNYWILIFLLIVLILVSIFVGSIYNTQGYYHEGFESGNGNGNGKDKSNNHTLYFFYMEQCGWCKDFKSKAWAQLKDDMDKNRQEYLFKVGEIDINDGEKGTQMAQKYKVKSAPTLILVNDNDDNDYEVFDQDRNIIEDLKKFGNKKAN